MQGEWHKRAMLFRTSLPSLMLASSLGTWDKSVLSPAVQAGRLVVQAPDASHLPCQTLQQDSCSGAAELMSARMTHPGLLAAPCSHMHCSESARSKNFTIVPDPYVMMQLFLDLGRLKPSIRL